METLFKQIIVKNKPILFICKYIDEWKDALPSNILEIVKILCEEGYYKKGNLKIVFFNGSFYGETAEDLLELITINDLISFLNSKR